MAEKRSKASVDYSVGGDHCGRCVHWIDADEDEEKSLLQKLRDVHRGHIAKGGAEMAEMRQEMQLIEKLIAHENEEKNEEETGKCELVEGNIGEDHWCKLFKRDRVVKSVKANHLRRIIGTM